MARRQRKPPIIVNPAAAAVPPPVKPVMSSTAILLWIIGFVFAIFMVVMLAVFHSDSENDLQVQRELATIDGIYAKKDYARAQDALLKFGNEYKGALVTYGWNEKMGRYSRLAGDWQSAAKFYSAAANINPAKPATHAFAGEALWKIGKKEAAIEMLRAELKDFEPSIGDHDRANFYLGVSMFEEGKIIFAFQHFQSIANREAWAEQLKPYYEKVNEEYIQPAAQIANATSNPTIP